MIQSMMMKPVAQDSMVRSVAGGGAASVSAGSAHAHQRSYPVHYHDGACESSSADVILQLKANIAQLEDLHARMNFLMKEIGYLLKVT